jgi:hypothetical protein
MLLLGCLLLLGGILGSYSGTLWNPHKNECVEGLEDHTYRMSKCAAGAPSQAWVLEGQFIKNKKSGTCLTSLPYGGVKPFACSKTLHDEEKLDMIKIEIEGTEVRTVTGWCLHNDGQKLEFMSCRFKPKSFPRIAFE